VGRAAWSPSIQSHQVCIELQRDETKCPVLKHGPRSLTYVRSRRVIKPNEQELEPLGGFSSLSGGGRLFRGEGFVQRMQSESEKGGKEAKRFVSKTGVSSFEQRGVTPTNISLCAPPASSRIRVVLFGLVSHEADPCSTRRGRELKHICWDPKDGELCLGRTKPGETLVEVRHDTDVQIVRQT
jgi:hypothetical protein